MADDLCIAPMPAEIDISNAERVRGDLLAAVNHNRIVVADLSLTSFCDCAGVSALLVAGSYAARTGAELLIVARARAVLRTFDLTGLPLALAVYATREEAQRAADSGQAQGGPPRPALSPVPSLLSFRRRTAAAVRVRPPSQRLDP